MEGILSKLDVYTREWAMTLTEDDMAKILQAVYKLPGLLETLKTKRLEEKPYQLDKTIEEKLDSLTFNTRTIMHMLTDNEESNAPATIGKIGEDKFMKLCSRLPTNYKVQNTSKQGKKGDFIITYSYMGIVKRCLVDIKNHSATIPKKEVDKFFEDLCFGSYDAGLLISYNSKFVGITEHIYLEDQCLPCGKIPVMYLNSSDELLILQAIELIIAKSIVHQNKDINIDRIESLIENINNSLSNSADVRRLLSELYSSVAKSIQKCQESLITHEAHIKRAIREMSGCVTKAMLQKIAPLIPTLEARADNMNPDQSISVSDDIKVNKTTDDFILKIAKQDRELFERLLALPWECVEYPTAQVAKNMCDLVSKNIIVAIVPLKTKTTVTMDFQEEIAIPDNEFDDLIYKISKDNSFICQLNEPLVTFIEKYMNY